MAKKTKLPAFSVEWWPIDKPIPYARNPRRNEAAVDVVAASLKEFGQRRAIVVDKEGVIVVGHTQLLAAKNLGLAQVPVHVAKDLTPAQIKAYRIMDNKSHEAAVWDTELLGLEIEDLKDLDFDIDLTGFSMDELNALLAQPVESTPADDEVPEPPKVPVTKPGDLWLLGDHRLLCGDSTKTEDVERVMGTDRAGLMNTDPPYGVSYANDERPNPGVAKPRVANDTFKDQELQSFLESVFGLAVVSALKPDAAWYLWHAHLTQGFFAAAAAAAAANVVLHRQIIWVKPVLLLGRGHYHWKHEPCFMGWVKGNEPPDYGLGNGERTQTTVWEVASVTQAERKEFDHSTPKPVELFTIPIVKHLKVGEICYEPFAGSGPQFIAAEKLNRRCYGIEIEPRYCDVIIKRWEHFTGQKAKRSTL